MQLPRRRLRAPRRLGRPGPPAGSVSPPAPAPSDPAPSYEAARRAQESTVEVPALSEEIPAPPAGNSPGHRTPPPPPPRIEFTCSCGANLVATPETYDKRSRCSECRTALLLNLVYDGDCRTYEIVPFPADPNGGA